MLLDQLGKWRSGNQYPFVNIIRLSHEPCAIEQIGGRDVFEATSADQASYQRYFTGGELGRPMSRIQIEGEMQAIKHEPGGFIPVL